MPGNIKIRLRSPVQRKDVLGIQTENDTASKISELDCEYERFDEIYRSNDTWSLHLSLHSVIIFTVQHDDRNKLYMEGGTRSYCTPSNTLNADLVTHLHLQFTLVMSFVLQR